MWHRESQVLNMMTYSCQSLEPGGSCQGAWGEGQTGSGEKAWGCEFIALGSRETQCAYGGGVKMGEDCGKDSFVPPEAGYWAS